MRSNTHDPRFLAGARLVTTVICALGFVAPASTSGSSDWAGFRGPGGNGQVVTATAAGVESGGAVHLRVGWQRSTGSGYSGIAVVGDWGVTAASRGDHDFVVAFDPTTGIERWTAEIGPRTVGLAGSKDGPISTPAVAEGRVFIVSTQGRLHALELTTGRTLWTKHLVDDLGSRRPAYGFATSPAVAGETLVVQCGGDAGALVGLDAATGAQRWRTFRDGHYAQSPIVTDLAGRQQVIAIGATQVIGVDPRTGQLLWSHEHGGVGEFGADSSSPMPIGGDRLFVQHDNEHSMVLEIGLEDDESMVAEVLVTSRVMTRSYAPPTLWDGAIYGYTSRFLSALDLENGDQLWRSRAPGDGFPVAVDGMLFIATKNEGSVHLGVADRAGWQEVDRLDLFDDLVWTPPAFADGSFFVRSLTSLARIDLVRGEGTGGRVTEALPPELEDLRRKIEAGGDATAAVDTLLRGLDGPLVDGERVIFLWRGDAEEVGIAGDMFGFRYDESMRRLDGTDLWWKQLELDRRGRFSYVFFPDYRPTLDPLNERIVEATVMGPDLNHRADDALKMSWFAMPDWPGNQPPAPSTVGDGGRLERFEVAVEVPAVPGPAGQMPARTVDVPVTVWLPPGYDVADQRYPTVFALESYAERLGSWPATLDAVVGDRVAPLVAVMIDPPSGFYGRRGGGAVSALVPTVLAAVDSRYRTIAEPEGRAVVGALYTAPPAIALSLGEGRVFGRLAIQSPFAIDAMMPMYRQRIDFGASAPDPAVFYFEWAHWEMRSRLEGLVLGDFMEDLYELFESEGYDLIGGEVWDSTDWAGWRNRTAVLLEALFPSQTGDARASLERWLVASQGGVDP